MGNEHIPLNHANYPSKQKQRLVFSHKVHLKQTFIKPVILLLTLGILSGCATKPKDPWSEFMHTVVTSARDKNYDKLTRELSLHRWEEIKAFFEQASIVAPVSPEDAPEDDELYRNMREDVKVFFRSYEDLFDGKPALYSTKRLDMDGVDLFSVILWVVKDSAYSGILIHAVWQRSDDLKVLEWVYTKPSDAPHLFKKRAKLVVTSLEECVFPEVIEFEED